MKASELQFGEYIHAMFVGVTGTRKTAAIGSFPEPIQILNFDGRRRVEPILALYPGKDIDIQNFSHKHTHEIEQKLDDIVQHPKKFATYGFDSFTFFMQHAIKYGMKNSNTELVGQMKVAGLKQYMVEASAANNLYDMIQEISNCHFLMTAHFLDKKDATGKIYARKLATAGNTPATLMPGIFSEIWSFHLEGSLIQGGKPKPYIITQSGSEDSPGTLEKSALATAGYIPTRLEYGDNLYTEIKKLLAVKGIALR